MLLKFSTEKEWLAYRKDDVTSTELASLFGLGRKSRLRLWAEKSGIVESDFEENNFTKWGRRLQNVVAYGICEDNGWECQDLTGLYYRDPIVRMGCSMDNLAIGPDIGRRILEIKVTEEFSPEKGWTVDRTPEDYEFQIHGQMHLAFKHGEDINGGMIGALGGRQKSMTWPREYDKELGALMDEECFSFWKSVENKVEPAPDYTVDSEILSALRGQIWEGEGCVLTGNNYAVEVMNRWVEANEASSKMKKLVEGLENTKTIAREEILQLMGRAEFAKIGGFKVKARIQEVEEKFVEAYSFRRFDVSKQKGK